ncbi:MAG: Ig-like domain-containing protein [Roseburia sp.]|nr:Ig-like domain-containing protein [Roseburia sp.]
MKKFAKKALAGALTLAMVMSMTAVVNPETASAKKVKVKKVTVAAPSGKTAYVAKGKKIKLTATVKVTPNKKANKKVTYKSANKKIATVNAKGQVKGVKAGKTKITVTAKKNTKKKATIKVVVKKAAVKKVKLNAKSISVAVGGKKTLKATVTPKKNTSNKIAWSSSKKKVATVSAKGVVKGKKEGTATITAKAADGSGKKATCKVQVGAGIKSLAVPHSEIVRVTLSSAKALNATDFTVQTKTTASRKYVNSIEVDQVRTTDGGKTYDVLINGDISKDTFLKVTISALKGENSKELFVEDIAGYGYGEDPIERVNDYQQGDSYSREWYITGVDTVGQLKYAVTGLPAGLKAYPSKDQTSMIVKGTFANVENGTTATLTGVDEKGKTVKKSYVFYVGNKSTLVGNVLSRTVLSYTPDNEETKADEETGFDFLDDRGFLRNGGMWTKISGGSGNYNYSVTGLPAAVDTMSVDGYIRSTDADDSYKRLPIAAGTYNAVLTVTDNYYEGVSAQFPFTITITDGVAVTGSVKDATGAVMKYTSVGGNTKMDAYGFINSLDARTKTDGTYATRVIPGDYCTSVNGWDLSVGNMFTAASVKDFSVPLYKVSFTTTIAGAAAYDTSSTPYFIDAYGRSYPLDSDPDDYTLYAYLRAGSYEMQSATGNVDQKIRYNNTVYAYTKVTTEPYKDGVRTYLSDNDQVGERAWQVSCAPFTVAGAMTVQLTGAMLPENANNYYYDD